MKITDDMIRLKAYEIWEQRGRPAGSAENDWYDAEESLRQESTPSMEKPKSNDPMPARQVKRTRYGLRKVKGA